MSAWDSKIEKAEKFRSKAVEHGRKVYARYEDEREDMLTRGAAKVNLFYSNVNTLKESLFNSMPKPDVTRLHKSDFDDDISRVAALILQRALNFEINNAPAFEEAVKSAILDRLVPGVGATWCRFDIEKDAQGNPITGTEKVYVDTVFWEDFLYEPARSWSKVGWVGRIHAYTKDELVKKFGEEKAGQVELVDSRTAPEGREINEGKHKVYEIWDKRTKKVFFIAKGHEEPLSESPDPYQLRDFFPCPPPLIANVTTQKFLPVTDYYISQDQYTQLDILYERITLIVKAIKVAGVYDSGSPEIAKMLSNGENTLIPVDNWAVFMERGGSKGMIDWYPVEQVVGVLQQLQQQFEAVKGVLYEVSGMSDIIRGASNQYETAAAQQIKAQFASVRMNGYQRDVAQFVSGVLNIIAELVVSLYSPEKLQAIVGQLSAPDMALAQQALDVLKNDFMMQCKVSVKADSLVQADWALEKTQKMELMGYISQYLQASVPAIEQNPSLGSLLLSLMKWTITGYRGAQEIEGVIDQQMDALIQAAQNPQPPQPSPEEQKAQMEMQKMQMEFEMDNQRNQMELGIKQQEATMKQQLEEQKMALDLQRAQMEYEHKQRMFELEEQMMLMKLQFTREEQSMKLHNQMISGDMKLQHQEQAGRLKMEQQHEANETKKQEAAEPEDD